MLDEEDDILFMFREIGHNIDCASAIFWCEIRG